MASRGAENIESLIEKLGSESLSTAKKALAALTKLTKNSENVSRLRLKGGLSRLLEFTRQPNQSLVDMALSALANCALDNECRKEIRRLDGIIPLVEILKVLHVTSIINRTARALANLAEDEVNSLVMDRLGIVTELAKALLEVSDSDCQQTLVRALRIICTTSSRKQTVLDLDCFKVIVELLKSEKTAVANSCIRTVAEFTKNCSKELAQQVQEYDGIKAIVKLTCSDRSVVRHAAVISLAHLAVHSHVRVCIGAEGGIQALCCQVKTNEPAHVTSKAIEGLCYCCREAINRNRVRECGALTLLLKLLSSGAYPQLHKKIVSAFTWFSYNEPCLEIMLNGGLVPALVSYLSKVISDESGCEEHEDDFCDQVNMSYTSDFSSPSASPLTSLGGSSMLSDFKDAMTGEGSSNETLEKLEDLAREVKDANETPSRISNFKRKLKLKAASLSTGVTSPNSKTIGHCQSAFSFSDTHSSKETQAVVSALDVTPLINASEVRDNSSHSVTQDLDSDQQSQVPVPSTVSFPACSTPLPGPTLEAIAIESTSSNSTGSNLPVDGCTFEQPESVFSKVEVPENAKSSPSVVSNSDFVLYPWFCHRRSRGHCALLLLSRISQMADPSAVLVTRPCIQVLLDYLSLVPERSPKCARLLNRLTTNPCCFEALVVKGIASWIHIQLCCGYRKKQPVAASSSPGNQQGSQTQEENSAAGSTTIVQEDHSVVGSSGQVQQEEFAGDSSSQWQEEKPTVSPSTQAQEKEFLDGSSTQAQGEKFAVDSHSQDQENNVAVRLSSQAQERSFAIGSSSQAQEENPKVGPSSQVQQSIFAVDAAVQVDRANVVEKNKDSDMVQPEFPPSALTYCHVFGNQLLENLSNQAQTPFGKGILSHLLLRGTQEECQSCLLTLPHVCRTKRLQRQMLIERKGLRMLCDLLTESTTEEVFGAVVESLTVVADGIELSPNLSKTFAMKGAVGLAGRTKNSKLAGHSDGSDISSKASATTRDLRVKCLKVEPQLSEVGTTPVSSCSQAPPVSGCSYINRSSQRSFDTQFKMDDGHIVPAHRDVLTATTDVFSAMLSNCFLEATQSVITIPEISPKVFTFALHCAYGCHTSTCSTLSATLKEFEDDTHAKHEFLFEVLACADRFIFNELKALCEKLLISVTQSPHDAVSLCVLGEYFHSSILCEFGLRYLLSTSSEPIIRQQSFKKILESSEKLLIVDQLYRILLSHLIEKD